VKKIFLCKIGAFGSVDNCKTRNVAMEDQKEANIRR